MAVVDASGTAVSLTKVHSYADRRVRRDLLSSFYQRMPLLAYMAGKGMDEKLDRPPGLGLISGAKLSKVEKANELGVEIHDRIQDSQIGGFKWMGARDTTPALGAGDSHDQNKRSAVHRWALAAQAVKVFNHVIRASRGAALANVLNEAVDEAMEELIQNINLSLWRGSPTDQSADHWDEILGILQGMDTNNTYGNIDRTVTTAWASNRVTTAKTPSLDLIDDANVTQGAQDKGPGVDFVLTGKDNYLKMKKEALARGQTITVGDMPGAALVGIKQEAIRYGNVWITYDPTLDSPPVGTTDWSSFDSDVTDSKKVLAAFTTEDWVFASHPSENFRLAPFHDQGELFPGGDDAITSSIRAMIRSRVRRPHRQVLYTNVS